MYFEMPTLQEILRDSGGDEELLEYLFHKFQLWLKQQAHLPQDITDQRLKYIIYAAKFDLTKAKKHLDMLYTLRSLVPKVYANFDPLSDDINQFHKYLQWVPLPKLTPKKIRVHIGRLINYDASIYNAWIVVRYIMMTLEVRLEKDIVPNIIIIWDCTGLNMQHILQYTPILLKVIDNCMEAYGTRIEAIYLINVPRFIDVLIKVIKIVMRAELHNNIYVYKSGIELLYEEIPKSILPMDYGGEQPSMDILTDMWSANLVKRRNWFLTEENRKSNETFRANSQIDPSNLFGVYKKLSELEIE